MNYPSLRVAIVGAGPAGLYAAGQLLEHTQLDIEIDLFDRLPTPHGLVRAGVAPDHVEKKRVIDNLFDHYLNHPKVRFFGNVDMGKTIDIRTLGSWYSAVIYAVGANNDAKLAIPGEDLPGSWAAREFVAWYNGHPDFSNLTFDFSASRAVVIGNGNVALDVARILTLPKSELEKTDIADYAIDALSASNINEVVVLARRSHFQAAFNNPEIEEFEHLNHLNIQVKGDDLSESVRNVFKASTWQDRRKAETIERLKRSINNNAEKRITFQFLSSPVAVLGKHKVSQLNVVKNRIVGERIGELKVIPTDEHSVIDTGLILRSIGYRGDALNGLPFDSVSGIIPNQDGRVVSSQGVLVGTYVTGWIKRGPQGVIGSNKKCARDTVQALLADMKNNQLNTSPLRADDVLIPLKKAAPHLIERHQWKQIDYLERSQGREANRPRMKKTQWQSLLDSAGVTTRVGLAGESR